MAIIFKKGDLWTDCPHAHIRVNAVNCKGIMGAGIAKQFKDKYPEMFKDYRDACNAGLLTPDNLHIFTNPDVTIVVNFPTKNSPYETARYNYIDRGLSALHTFLFDSFNDQSYIVAMPALGCGLGALDWNIVKASIIRELCDLHTTIVVFEPR